MKATDLERFNGWWSTGKVKSSLAPDYRRRPFSDASKLLRQRQAVVLSGLRRVGKSTILYQLIDGLLEDGTDPRNVLYFSFEEGGEEVKEVIEEYERSVLRKNLDEAGKVYIFLDEVQYAKDWVTAVKRFYDIYPSLKFYLSGSSSLLISAKALQNLAGRFFLVDVYPMTFREFVEVKGALRPGGAPSSRLEPIFSQYLTKAGFPEIAGLEDEGLVAEYVKNSVLDRVTLRDVPALFGRRDVMLLGRLLTSVVSSPGGMVNLNALSSGLGADRVTISRYLRSLEGSLLLRSLGNFRPSPRSESRKLRKYYPSTTSMVFAVARRSFDASPGAVLETYVVNALGASRFYKRGGKEVDVVLRDGEECVEVKVSPDGRDAARLSRAAGELGAKKKLMVSWSDRTRVGGVDVIPAYALDWEGPGLLK